MIDIFIQIGDKDANDLIVIELICSGNGGGYQEHVRDFDDVDLINVGSVEELNQSWWFVGLFEPNDKCHSLSYYCCEVTLENLDEEHVFGTVV